ncbi:hypothetical protein MY11210_001283 [Beauveria gryllotalpidicola]
MAKTVDTFIAFGADIFALERMMRLLQAICLILTSYTSLLALLQPSAGAVQQHLATRATLLALQDWLNVTRRSLRTFWFLRAFDGSYARFRQAGPLPGAEALLDVVAGSLLGVFGLLETATLPDALRIPGLAAFGPDAARRLNAQAQLCWLLALLAAVLGAGVRVCRLWAERAVPAPAAADFGDEEEERGGEDGLVKKREAALEKRRRDKEEAAGKTRAEIAALTVKMVNDTLDMVIPANFCGWSNFHPGQVGVAMAVTSLITLRGHWERCGRAVQ